MVSQVDLVAPQLVADRLIQSWLALLNLLQRGFDLLLETFLEVELVEGAKGHHRVEQVGGVQTACTYLLRVFQAKKDYYLAVHLTLLTIIGQLLLKRF